MEQIHKSVTTMKEFRLIFQICTLLGVLHSKNSSKNGHFTLAKLLVPYSILLSLFIVSFIVIEGYVNRDDIAALTFGHLTTAHQHHWFINFTLLLHFTSDTITNVCTVVTILMHKAQHCNLLNQLLEIETTLGASNTHKSRIHATFYALLFNHLIAFPLYIYLQIGVSWFSLTRLIAVNFHSVQYEFGHLYEMVVLGKLTTFFSSVSLLKMNDEADVRHFIVQFDSVLTLTKSAMKLFQVNKIVCLICINLLFSFSFFYDLDRIENIELSFLHWISIFLRQSVLGIIFVVCNNWHGLMEQVSHLLSE